MLPHRCLVENIDAIVDGAGLGVDDVGVSWLPLYHDMGLIGLLMTPMTHRVRPRPRAAPGLPLGAGRLDALDVGDARHGHRGPELRVRARGACAAATRRARPVAVAASRSTAPSRSTRRRSRASSTPARAHGLDSKAAFCVYGMAEATLAISFPEPGTGMAVDTVDRAALEHERYAATGERARRDAGACRCSVARSAGSSCASPTPRPERRVRDREVGELELRGTSVTPGYFAPPRADRRRPSTTAGCAPATSATWSTERSSSADGSRT